MKKLLVGFDSAWSANNDGALCAAQIDEKNSIMLTLPPTTANFEEAKNKIDLQRQGDLETVIFLDQPHIVNNPSGSRPVERIVGSPVGSRYGGVQRSATTNPPDRVLMFGPDAPVWEFTEHFGGPTNPFDFANRRCSILETYPVLYIIASGWLLPDGRTTGRLPKYNPQRRKTFLLDDWKFIIEKVISRSAEIGFQDLGAWLRSYALDVPAPNKQLQDKLDSAICLLQAVEWHFSHEFLVVGDITTGYIVTKSNESLEQELRNRCEYLARKGLDGINWDADNWVRRVKKIDSTNGARL